MFECLTNNSFGTYIYGMAIEMAIEKGFFNILDVDTSSNNLDEDCISTFDKACIFLAQRDPIGGIIYGVTENGDFVRAEPDNECWAEMLG